MKFFFRKYPLLLALIFCVSAKSQNTDTIVQFIFTSDAHYGLTKNTFQGNTNVDASEVNKAMIKKMNTLPQLVLPNDGGVNAGNKIRYVDFLMQTGDIANRMDIPYQTASASWLQFEADYLKGIAIKNSKGKPIQFCIVPGNHDATNAIGFYKPLKPLTDATSIVNIYNLMMQPAKPKTTATYNYETDKINYSKNIGGIHFIFLTIWPDSLERVWMEKDLATITATTPVVIFTHDTPEGDAKHFTNPNAPYTINATDNFENLLSEKYKDGSNAKADGASTIIEQRGFVSFLKKHPNIKAYFHGHSNFNEFYTYKGPDNDIALPAFRADSPMKGKLSSKDETKLSFQFISINTKTGMLTARECLWNTSPANITAPIVFGESKTIQLK